MKKRVCADGLRRWIPALLACTMLLSLLPASVFAAGESTSVAILLTSEEYLDPGEKYVLVNGNTPGEAVALSGNGTAGSSVTILDQDDRYGSCYIENPDDAIVWEVLPGATFRNGAGGGYLSRDRNNNLLLNDASSTDWTHDKKMNRLAYTAANGYTYYLRYRSGKWSLTNSNVKDCVYIYRVEEIQSKPTAPLEVAPDTFVLDYGLDAIIDVTGNDRTRGAISGISLIPVEDVDLYTDISDTGHFPDTELTAENGISLLVEDGGIRVCQHTMSFSEPITFYYESHVEYGNGGEMGFMYSSVTLFPATSIYYEEDFVTFTDSSAAAEGVGAWSTEGTAKECTQQTASSSGERYGYDEAYGDSKTYSLGSARKVTVNAATGAADTAPEAGFTFTGTGFDIISLTNSESGTIVVTVEGENGFRATGSVDTYYGYAYEDGAWHVSPGEVTLWQVPVVKMSGLSYGTYTVTIQPAYLKSLDHAADGQYSFWLDAVRIYDPAGDHAQVSAAHAGDGERDPSYVTVRDVLAAADSLNAGDGRSPGAVFVDGMAETDSICTYTGAGPNHETYLAQGQGVAFRLLADRQPESIHLGIRLATGDSGTLRLGEEDELVIATAADLYYDLGSKLSWTQVGDRYESGVILITNPSDCILSLTNLKATGGVNWDLSGASAVALADEGAVFTIIPVADEETVMFARNTVRRLYSAGKPGFKDVSAGAWYAGAVDYVADRGLMAGVDGVFLPEGKVSRAQVVQTLFSLAGKPSSAGGAAFSDVAADSWYADAVNWAFATGVAAGAGGAFAPEANVTREQLALFLYAYSGARQTDIDLSSFADHASVSVWASDAVEWAVSRGLISGKSGGRLDPQGTATRGELAQILMNFDKNQ